MMQQKPEEFYTFQILNKLGAAFTRVYHDNQWFIPRVLEEGYDETLKPYFTV